MFTVEEIDRLLPRKYFVMRGDIRVAFGFSSEELDALVANSTFVAKYPVVGGRARFVRSQVIAIARSWEGQR
jgi:hypothetical protein